MPVDAWLGERRTVTGEDLLAEFGVMGPLEWRVAGRVVDLGPQKQRAVLAALLVDAGRLVTLESLVDRVWDDRPPPKARSVLYAHIARIRRLLSSATTTTTLRRRSGGYVLELEPDRVDLHLFRRLVEQGRAPGTPAPQRAAALGAALDLRRGPALADLSGGWVAGLRSALEQQQIATLLAWAEVELELGHAAAVIQEIGASVQEHPLVEPLVEALMRALAADGRPAEALARFAEMRQRLATELGTDPGPALSRQHTAILRAESGERPDRPTPGDRHAVVRVPVPAQLPPDIAGFAGRETELRQLDRLAMDAGAGDSPVVISAIAGMPGVGKTALAVRWAHRIAGRFPDGQLYVNLRGFDPGGMAMNPSEALHGFLTALGTTADLVPPTLDAQAALYRSRLAGRRVLIVLDNARDTAHVRPLLPGSSGCLVLVTSRDQMTGLVASHGARPFTVDLMSDGEARQLLARRVGRDRLAAEPEAVDQIVKSSVRLPLALAIVAARAAARPGFPLAVLAAELAQGGSQLDAFAGGDALTDVRNVFSWSYHQLPAETARLFRLLGLHPGPDITPPAAASLAGRADGQVRGMLAELARAHLITEHEPGRYTFHDLLRSYAAELADALDHDPERHAAVHRMIDHYLHTAHAATLLSNPGRYAVIALPAREPGAGFEALPDRNGAVAWFAAEHHVLRAAIRLACEYDFDTHAWQLAWAVGDFLDRQGFWADWRDVVQVALTAVERSGDRSGQANMHRCLGRVAIRLGDGREADQHFDRALGLFRALDNAVDQAHVHINFGFMCEQRGHYADALEHAKLALQQFTAAGHETGQARALSAVGWLQAKLGDHEQAIRCCRQAIAQLQRLGDPRGEAHAWDSLGYAHHHLGRYQQAIDCYREALTLFEDARDRLNQAEVLDHLGDTYQAIGDVNAARAAWQSAADITHQLGRAEAAAIRAKMHENESDRRG
jgi:DNA-binding SARP family transcriptional activator/tetratricopeptide (TPR) repeat protein